MAMIRRKRIDWPEHDAPDAAAVDAIHRGHDAFVILCRRDERRGWHEGFSRIRASDLREMFPAIAQELLTDSYYSVNGFYKPWRTSELLRYLTCTYADLDCYKVRMSVGQAVGFVIDAQDAGLIPPATIIGRSGRGIWLFWRLHEAGSLLTNPVRAWPERVELWGRIQRATFERLASIGADAQARDAARVTRIPGSIHSGTGEQVSYWLQLDPDGRPYEYTLTELADFFGLETQTRIPKAVRTAADVDPAVSAVKRRGYNALHAKRLRQLVTLESLRGGFHEGCRNRAALLYASFLHSQHIPALTLARDVRAFGYRCTPPLTQDECNDVVATATTKKGLRFTDELISDWLDITPDESELLESWQPALRFLPNASRPAAPSRLAAQTLRRATIRQICDERGTVPTLRELARMIARETGIRAELETIRTDLARLGIANPRTRRPNIPGDPLDF